MYLYQLAEPYVTKIGQQIWAQILSTFEWLWNSIANPKFQHKSKKSYLGVNIFHFYVVFGVNFDYSLPINITGVAVSLMMLMLPVPANVLFFGIIYAQLGASLGSCN